MNRSKVQEDIGHGLPAKQHHPKRKKTGAAKWRQSQRKRMEQVRKETGI